MPAPTGTFTIMENGLPVAGPFTADANGKAFPTDNTTSLLTPGEHDLVCHYEPDGSSPYPAADSPVYKLNITPPAVAVTIGGNPNPVPYGSPIIWSLIAAAV